MKLPIAVTAFCLLAASANAAGCGSGFSRSDIREKIRTHTGEGTDLLDQCATCKMVIDLFDGWLKAGKSAAFIADHAIAVCKTFKIFPDDVCKGMVDISAPPVVYVLNNTQYDADTVCNTFLGVCDTPLPRWTLKVPGGKPPVKPRTPNKGPPRTLKVLQFSDTHYDPLYAPGSLANCQHPRCCRDTYHDPLPAHPMYAGYWGNSVTTTEGSQGCDPPLWTMQAAFAAAAALKPDIIYFTGDIPPHDVWMQSHASNVERIKNTTAIFKKFFPDIPIAYAIGNHEAAPVNSFSVPEVYDKGFSMDYLYSVLEVIWTAAGVPAEQGKNIRAGGYYQWSPFKGLRVVALNSNYGMKDDWWMLIDDQDPTGQLAWLTTVLQDAESVGDRVHLIHHHDGGKPLPSFSQAYNALLTRFENTVVGIFTGHTHMDEFKVNFDVANNSRPVGITYLCPSISSDGDKSPSFRVYEIDGGYETIDGVNATWEVIDSYTYSLNLTLANNGSVPEFPLAYSARKSYGMTDLSPESWADAAWRMAGDPATYYEYFKNYYNFAAQPPQWTNGYCDRSCKAFKTCAMYLGNSADEAPCSRIEARFYKNFPNASLPID